MCCWWWMQCSLHIYIYQPDTSGCFTQIPVCLRIFVQSGVLLTLAGGCHCPCPCMEYDTARGKKNNGAAGGSSRRGAGLSKELVWRCTVWACRLWQTGLNVRRWRACRGSLLTLRSVWVKCLQELGQTPLPPTPPCGLSHLIYQWIIFTLLSLRAFEKLHACTLSHVCNLCGLQDVNHTFLRFRLTHAVLVRIIHKFRNKSKYSEQARKVNISKKII